MEGEGETLTNSDEPSIVELNDSKIQEKVLEIEKLTSTVQCESLVCGAESSIAEKDNAVVGSKIETDMEDSKLVGAEVAMVEEQDEQVVAEKGIAEADIKTEMVTEAEIGSGEKSVHVSHESRVVSAESVIFEKEDEAVAEEDSLTLDAKMEKVTEGAIDGGEKSVIVAKEEEAVVDTRMEKMMDDAVGGVEKSVTESHKPQVVAAGSLVVAEGIKAVVAEEENVTGDTKMEVVTEVAICLEEKLVSNLDDLQLVGVESPIVAKDDITDGVDDKVVLEEDVLMVDNNMEVEVKKEDGTEHIPALHDLQLISAEIKISPKEKDHREVAVMETETESRTVKVPELYDSDLIGAEPATAAKGNHDNEVVAGEDIEAADTKMGTETETDTEVTKGSEGVSVAELDDLHVVGAVSPVAQDDEEEAMVAEEETPTADTEMDTEMEVVESGKGAVGKRRRGRISKVPARATTRKTIEEDVCFICFDGGDLVLCDRRGCPKAYHPSCVNRDEAFFRAKGRWNCGWHLCSKCEKNAYYMCYTCTFSLCKGCIKDATILCVRGNKGFCETCLKTVMLIENKEQGNKETQVDFDDKSSWEYLCKDYWVDLKAKLSLSSVELEQAKNPWKGSDVLAGKQEPPDESFEANNDGGTGSDKSAENLDGGKSKRRKSKKRLKSFSKEQDSTNAAAVAVRADGGSGSDNSAENLEISKFKRRKSKKRLKSLSKEEVLTVAVVAVGAEGTSTPGNTEWASKELLEFVMHMKNGERSFLSQFDVQALLLEYIKINKLRDPRRKSQIICDLRLENLFGKARVGHFEMLKLLESHFLIKEDSQIDDIQGSVVNNEINQVEADGSTDTLTKEVKDRKRKIRRKGDRRGPLSNLDDYAAIDMHNINLIYLRRKLMEDLLEDIEKFHDRVVGTFVRIRISGSNQKQDIYRLVQVVGTSKAAERYKIGKRATDVMLEILNLNKTEVISTDTISNQEFTEDECKRLRQSIKCGLISRLTVGDILDKAMEVQAARVNDWFETEIVRLCHLRDRASEKGRLKELRECVEKLQLLKTPEERRYRLEEIPEIHADPNMDPSYESEEDDSEMDDNRRDVYMRHRGSGFSRRGKEPISPGRGDFSSKDSWSGTRKNTSNNWDSNRKLYDKNISNKDEGATLVGEILNEKSWNQGRDRDAQQSNNLEKPSSANNSRSVGWNSHSGVKSESFAAVASETSLGSLSDVVAETAPKINETEKVWHYRDPSGKVQGPFSLVQLRKWNNTGYFPVDLRIWKATENQDDSILLTDALAGRLQKVLPKSSTLRSPQLSSAHAENTHNNSSPSYRSPGGNLISQPDPGSSRGWMTPSVEAPKSSTDRWVSDHGSRNDSASLPSPTPKQSTAGLTGGEAGLLTSVSSLPGVTGALQSPAAVTPSSVLLTHSTSATGNPSEIKEHSTMGSLSVLAPSSVISPGGQFMRGSENDSSSSHPQVPNSEQGILVGPTNSLQTSQSTVTGDSNIQAHSYLVPASDMATQTVQSVGSQNHPVETHGWGSASSQNSAIPMPAQPLAYHWGAVPAAVQNHPGNFSTPGVSLPPPDAWRPQIQGNQPNMQASVVPNAPWGVGVTENSGSAPGSRPDNPNIGWGTVQGNPNMGWGGPGPIPGGMNMNWGATVQVPPSNANPGWFIPTGNPGAIVRGPVPGNVNPGWVAPSGNPGAIVQGMPPGNANAGWVAPVQGPIPGHGNLGWVPPNGNPGAPVQGPAPGSVNPGWVPPNGTPGASVQGSAPGSANPRWVAPAENQSTWRGSEQRNGNRFSSQRERGSQGRDSGFSGGRPWQSSGLPKGQIECPYQKYRRCRKGASCDYKHT